MGIGRVGTRGTVRFGIRRARVLTGRVCPNFSVQVPARQETGPPGRAFRRSTAWGKTLTLSEALALCVRRVVRRFESLTVWIYYSWFA